MRTLRGASASGVRMSCCRFSTSHARPSSSRSHVDWRAGARRTPHAPPPPAPHCAAATAHTGVRRGSRRPSPPGFPRRSSATALHPRACAKCPPGTRWAWWLPSRCAWPGCPLRCPDRCWRGRGGRWAPPRPPPPPPPRASPSRGAGEKSSQGGGACRRGRVGGAEQGRRAACWRGVPATRLKRGALRRSQPMPVKLRSIFSCSRKAMCASAGAHARPSTAPDCKGGWGHGGSTGGLRGGLATRARLPASPLP